MISRKEIATHNGHPIFRYTIENNNGVRLSALNYGCIITEWTAPDQDGRLENIVLGYEDFSRYLTDSPYFGAIVGRFAGRIENASFALDNETFSLAKNDGENSLHGGDEGFDKKVWAVTEQDQTLVFNLTSPHLEEGFPGELTIQVSYTLTDENELRIKYNATTDRKTVINMTNHTYFNLTGTLQPVLNHELKIPADTYLPLKETLIPTGELRNVENTPFDFRESKRLADALDLQDEQIKIGGNGYDHPFVLNEGIIQLSEPVSRRRLTIHTDQPAVVFYAGNQLGKEGAMRGEKIQAHSGLCLETQGLPNAMNEPSFPSCELSPGETYSSETIYRLTTY
ncbi:aldose epimerase family protein [Jeotgalibacillus haloalkalitolerans]|uniref:Aldose 1-epimerase n=1 Tax=Jeotgalibacillus haloalkalitolerans TaxID=3104292 RepID=A0ABU5KJ79_9BACL|nr:aldose epimerase family protein [Jeotgalibacillus sp. HH7-29]MDZ5711235.1 aldose epimerase family protein [Jeotgalibacillus sp. HH7-29]